MKTVSFFGDSHFYSGNEFSNLLISHVERLIVSDNAVKFLFGGYGRFDSFCHSAVCKLKTQFPHIKTIFVQAYYYFKNNNYINPLRSYDETVNLNIENMPKKLAVVYRNQEIVDMSDYCIFYIDNNRGSAYHAMQYANIKKKNVINLAESGTYDEIQIRKS